MPREARCTMLRRFLAIGYDTLLLSAVLFLATLIVLPLTGGRAIGSNNPLYTAYIVAVAFGYFAWPWVHGGRTLGMRAWHIRLRRLDGRPPGWLDAGWRFVFAILSWLLLGLGFAWALCDRQRLALHDRLSGTHLVTAKPETPP